CDARTNPMQARRSRRDFATFLWERRSRRDSRPDGRSYKDHAPAKVVASEGLALLLPTAAIFRGKQAMEASALASLSALVGKVSDVVWGVPMLVLIAG